MCVCERERKKERDWRWKLRVSACDTLQSYDKFEQTVLEIVKVDEEYSKHHWESQENSKMS